MAPAFMARTDIGMSPCPVMNTIGIRMPAFTNSAWKSRPLDPGRRTSSTRQLGTSGRALCRNCCAEANTSARNCTDSKSLASARRMASSSSTTKTMGDPTPQTDFADGLRWVTMSCHPLSCLAVRGKPPRATPVRKARERTFPPDIQSPNPNSRLSGCNWSDLNASENAPRTNKASIAVRHILAETAKPANPHDISAALCSSSSRLPGRHTVAFYESAVKRIGFVRVTSRRTDRGANRAFPGQACGPYLLTSLFLETPRTMSAEGVVRIRNHRLSVAARGSAFRKNAWPLWKPRRQCLLIPQQGDRHR
jgi:hypothetical protein